ncbi:proteasome accessory factor PafA2 family protein [uncultured Bifidobacterium sp.]|uniref:proteasome accessory factor PafA2 family protein n=1 Tax=uncultured Bifidobacterium sp. TaxID=165187 RepID=UPI00261D2632|nr:proteasome accessory factor PafA2 family protein [uncultured Bifidobacterium sp.]
MPQLHDSGSRRVGNADRSPEFEGFSRIFGIETEYGISVTGDSHHDDPSAVALAMYRPIVSRCRSTNTYLTNGARLYLDVGSHPEYATAECRDPYDALVQDRAGEEVMSRLAVDAQRRMAAQSGRAVKVHLFKNNVDSAGHSFGCHENYLLRRFVPLDMVERELVPFLVTRQIFSGAGRVTADGFELSQRAGFLDEAVSSATTRARPMVNTRDEPHADPEEFRRLHVIIGDSNRSQYATRMKLATTHLVLCVMEDAARHGVASGFEDCGLESPGKANRRVSAGGPSTVVELRDGRGLSKIRDGVGTRSNTATAVDVQRRYIAIVTRFLDSKGEKVDAGLTTSSARSIVEEWTELVDAAAAGDVRALSNRVDWAAKKRLIARWRARGVTDSRRFAELDLDYHDIVNGASYPALLARGLMRVEVGADVVDSAIENPPSDTRAALRGRFMRSALRSAHQWSCDWTRVAITGDDRHEAMLIDPFDSAPSEGYLRVLDMLDALTEDTSPERR